MSHDEFIDLTVSQMVARGVDHVKATCGYCGRSWDAPISVMPDGTSLRKIRALLVCPTCTKSDIEVEPNWPTPIATH